MVVTRHGDKRRLAIKVQGTQRWGAELRREIDQPLRVAVALPLVTTQLVRTLLSVCALAHVPQVEGACLHSLDLWARKT